MLNARYAVEAATCFALDLRGEHFLALLGHRVVGHFNFQGARLRCCYGCFFPTVYFLGSGEVCSANDDGIGGINASVDWNAQQFFDALPHKRRVGCSANHQNEFQILWAEHELRVRIFLSMSAVLSIASLMMPSYSDRVMGIPEPSPAQRGGGPLHRSHSIDCPKPADQWSTDRCGSWVGLTLDRLGRQALPGRFAPPGFPRRKTPNSE